MLNRDELLKYAPNFTAKEEQIAVEQGYEDAADKWADEMEYRDYAEYHNSVSKRAKAQFRSDLESVGKDFDKLGELGRAANGFPFSPEYNPPNEVGVPKDPYTKRAGINGLKNRAVNLINTIRIKGLSYDEDGLHDSLDRTEEFWHYSEEWNDIEKRLNAHGVSMDEVICEIDAGETVYEDTFQEIPEVRDPELRRVFNEYAKDMKRADENNQCEDDDDWGD